MGSKPWQLLTALALVGGVAIGVGYYVYHFLAEQDFLIDQNRRIVREISKQVTSEIEGVAPMMRNAARELYRGNFYLKGRPYPHTRRGRQIRIKRVEDFVEQLPGFELVSLEPVGRLVRGPSEPVETLDSIDPVLSRAGDRLRIELSPLPYCCACSATGVADCEIAIVVEADPESLFQSIAHSSQFADVLVADEEGSIIVQRKARRDPTKHLDALLTSVIEPELASRASSVVAGTSHRLRAEVGGEEHWLLLQPTPIRKLKVRDPSSDDGEAPELRSFVWTVVALMPAREFLQTALDIPTTLVLLPIVVSLIVMLLGSLWLKLWNCGPYEAIGRLEVALAAFAFAALVGVLAMAVLDQALIRDRSRVLDDDLEHFANELNRNFDAELQQAYRQLEEAAPALVEALKRQKRRNVFDDSRLTEAFLPEANVLAASGRSELFGDYPYFEQLVWLDRAGFQRVKWASHGIPTPAGFYKDRPYFAKASRRDLWRRESLGTCPSGKLAGRGRGFFIEPIQSRTTGQRRAVLSAPVDDRGTLLDCAEAGVFDSEETDPNVVTLVTKLHAFDRPVIPPGLDFVVVDENGEIRFYSSADTRLREMIEENLRQAKVSRFIESVRDAREGGKTSEEGQPYSNRYHGRSLHFFVKPLAEPPWTLVTVGTSDEREAINKRALLELAPRFVLYAVLLVSLVSFAAWAASLRYEMRSDRWMWPNAERTPAYLQLGLAFASLSATTWIAFVSGDSPYWTFGPEHLLFAGLVIFALVAFSLGVRQGWTRWVRTTALALLVMGALVAFDFETPYWFAIMATAGIVLVAILEEQTRELARRMLALRGLAFSLFGVSFAVILGAVPAVVLFQTAVNSELEQAVVEERKMFGERVAGWVERQNGSSQESVRKLLSSQRSERVEDACASPKGADWPVYLRGELGKGCALTGMPEADGDESPLDRVADRFQLSGGPTEFRGLSSEYLTRPTLFGFALLGLAVAIVARRSLGIAHDWQLDTTDRLASSRGGRWLHVGSSKEIDASAIDGAGSNEVAIIDMRIAAQRQTATNAKVEYVLLRYFESLLGSPGLRAEAIELIDDLIKAGKKVHIACEVEPLRWLSDPIRRDREDVQKDLPQWADVFARFRVRHRSVASQDPGGDRVTTKILRECGVSPRLNTLAKHLQRKRPKFQLIENMVLRRARAEFVRLWELCTDRERAVLYLLAQGNIVSYPNRQVAAELERRGLIVRDGGMWIASGAFRRFVLATVTPGDERRWNQLGGGPGWALWRNALLVVLALGAGFVAVTQRDVFLSLGAFLGVLAGLPLVARLMSGFSGASDK